MTVRAHEEPLSWRMFAAGIATGGVGAALILHPSAPASRKAVLAGIWITVVLVCFVTRRRKARR